MTADDGTVTIHDVTLVAMPIGVAGRTTGLAATA